MEYLHEFAENVWLADGPVVRDMGTYFYDPHDDCEAFRWVSMDQFSGPGIICHVEIDFRIGRGALPDRCNAETCLEIIELAYPLSRCRIVGFSSNVIYASNKSGPGLRLLE